MEEGNKPSTETLRWRIDEFLKAVPDEDIDSFQESLVDMIKSIPTQDGSPIHQSYVVVGSYMAAWGYWFAKHGKESKADHE